MPIRGKVSWFNAAKGFGCIRAEDGSDVFVNFADIRADFKVLKEGDEVEFEVRKGDRFPEAKEVRRLTP